MRRINAFTVLASMLLSLLLSSCETLDRFYAEMSEYEETEEEKAIQYPYTVYAWYKFKLVKVEFLDNESMTVSFPKISRETKVAYSYRMNKTLYSWKSGHRDMQLCGISLKTVRESDGFEDWMDFTRKGDFGKPVSDPKNYRSIRTKDKTYIPLFFFGGSVTWEKFEDDYDFAYDAIPNIKFQRADQLEEYARESRRSQGKVGGEMSVRRQYKK